jgi:hypothetical protein
MAPVHRFITLNALECYVGQMNNAIFYVCKLMCISLKHIMWDALIL